MTLEFPEISKRLLAASGAGLIALAALSACGAEDSGSDDTENAAEAGDEVPPKKRQSRPARSPRPSRAVAPTSPRRSSCARPRASRAWASPSPRSTLDATARSWARTVQRRARRRLAVPHVHADGTNTGTETVDPCIGVNTAVWASRTPATTARLHERRRERHRHRPATSSRARPPPRTACVLVDPAGVEESCSPFATSCRMDETEVLCRDRLVPTHRPEDAETIGRNPRPPLRPNHSARNSRGLLPA